MSDKAKYVWAQIIVVVLWMHWTWGYLWLCGVWLVPLVTSVVAPVIAYPPLAVILGAVTFVVPSFLLMLPLVLLAMGVYKMLGIWHMWGGTESE